MNCCSSRVRLCSRLIALITLIAALRVKRENESVTDPFTSQPKGNNPYQPTDRHDGHPKQSTQNKRLEAAPSSPPLDLLTRRSSLELITAIW